MILNANNSKARILVVEDDVDVRTTLVAQVRRLQFDCDEAPDGHAACAKLRTHKYQLVLADINMPGNCSLELLDAADELAPGVPFILITGSPSRESAMDAVGTQATAYLEKPVTLPRLKQAIERALVRADAAESENRQVMREVVTVLNETRQNFKSKRLADLRKKVETALGEAREK